MLTMENLFTSVLSFFGGVTVLYVAYAVYMILSAKERRRFDESLKAVHEDGNRILLVVASNQVELHKELAAINDKLAAHSVSRPPGKK